MLKAEDYKAYNIGSRKKLRISKCCLSKWVYYERNATKLNPWELHRARILYRILGHFTKEERNFLANKYRNESYKNDKVASKEYGMKQREYSKLRKGIELKFFHYLKQVEGEAL